MLDSLDDTYPGFDWKKRSAYMLERVMTHGVRRAAEMREVALTVELLGLSGAMSRASVGWQQAIGELGLRATPEEALDYRVLTNRILSRLGAKDPESSSVRWLRAANVAPRSHSSRRLQFTREEKSMIGKLCRLGPRSARS